MLRLGLELTGVVAILAPQPWIAWFCVLGGELLGADRIWFWAALALGCLLVPLLLTVRWRVFGRIGARGLFDAWLVAFPPALGLALLAVQGKFPLSFRGFDAHGAGASGGEANLFLLPWLHAGIWIAVARWSQRGSSRPGHDHCETHGYR